MKKIFISHSSLDKEIIDVFIDKILRLGLNIETNDIACTSREDTGVRTGDDIKLFIKENISACDFVFFMISDNYRNSPICLNEMGAAWATDRKVIPIIFPNIGFDSIGWLYNVTKGIRINDSLALDSLYDDINEVCKTGLRISTWNKNKNDFLDFVGHKFNNKLILAAESSKTDEIDDAEFDLLDLREMFDENIKLALDSMERMTISMSTNTEHTNKTTKVLTNIQNNPNMSVGQVRPVLLKLAHEINNLSDVYELEIPIFKSSFLKALDTAIHMRDLHSLDNESIDDERDSLNSLINEMLNFREAMSNCKETLIKNDTKLDKQYTRSQKRLILNFTNLIETIDILHDKANELLNYT
jgi:hypothetical protein